ncbi:tellurite resistance TerB family protein [Streptomyces violens]|uniref:tellurite resistance TerB family protein n=1 Tax=Streptomyces violens TaxID=66377 RepID=UPI0004BE9982|nr:TerB family tellurite resistance protein [Streptomyces violens]
MVVWGRLKASASAMQAQLISRKQELRSGAFRDASMAMCALVAAADGIIDPAEQVRVSQLIATNEVLQNFAADDLQRLFEENLDRLALNFEHGKTTVLHEVGKAKKKTTEARAVIQIGIIIGGADGAFIESEQAIVREACRALGLPPQEFGL